MPTKPKKEAGAISLFLGIIASLIASYIFYFIHSSPSPPPPTTTINNYATQNYISGNDNLVIGEIKSFGKDYGENFKVVRYDSTRGDFQLQSRDITFELNRKGIYGEDVKIAYSYGYSLNIGFSRFENGEYKTPESSNALNQLIHLIVKSLKGDYTGTSKIKGSLRGFADNTPVKRSARYKGDLDYIQDQPYSIIPFNSSNKIIQPNKFLTQGDKLKNEDFAFLRAYHLKKLMLDSIKSPSNIKPIIEQRSIEISVTTVPEENPEKRKVEAVLNFEGALKDKLDRLDTASKEKLKKIYSQNK